MHLLLCLLLWKLVEHSIAGYYWIWSTCKLDISNAGFVWICAHYCNCILQMRRLVRFAFIIASADRKILKEIKKFGLTEILCTIFISGSSSTSLWWCLGLSFTLSDPSHPSHIAHTILPNLTASKVNLTTWNV